MYSAVKPVRGSRPGSLFVHHRAAQGAALLSVTSLRLTTGPGLILPKRPYIHMMSSSNFYTLLGVSQDADVKEIKAAFRRKARALHPDVNKSPSADQSFIQLRRAYTTLLQPSLRAEHDAKLGVSSAKGRAKDPRFARFERWRSEVIPELERILEAWTHEIDQIVAEWDGLMRRHHGDVVIALEQMSALQRARAMQARAAFSASSDDEAPTRVWPPPLGASVGPGPVWPPPIDMSVDYAAGSMSMDGGMDGGMGGGMGSGHGAYGSVGGAAAHAQQQQQQAPGGGARRVTLADTYTVTDDLMGPQAMQERAEESIKVLESALGDLEARVRRQYDKRYEQVCQRFPAYPDLVWMDEWEEASGAWLQRAAQCTRQWEQSIALARDQLRHAKGSSMY